MPHCDRFAYASGPFQGGALASLHAAQSAQTAALLASAHANGSMHGGMSTGNIPSVTAGVGAQNSGIGVLGLGVAADSRDSRGRDGDAMAVAGTAAARGDVSMGQRLKDARGGVEGGGGGGVRGRSERGVMGGERTGRGERPARVWPFEDDALHTILQWLHGRLPHPRRGV